MSFQNIPELSRFKQICELGKGAYGEVVAVIDSDTGFIFALKKSIKDTELDGIPLRTLREISIMKQLSHASILELRGVSMSSKHIYVLFDYMEYDLREFLSNRIIDLGQVKKLLKQLLEGVHYCHTNRVMHRDLKPENLLLDFKGNLKIADFGLSRNFYIPNQPLTPNTQTLWYRAPEILMGFNKYTQAVDMWSVGCIFAEMITRAPLFPSSSSFDQLNTISKKLGIQCDRTWKALSYHELCSNRAFVYDKTVLKLSVNDPQAVDLLGKMIEFNFHYRISAKEALDHSFFK